MRSPATPPSSGDLPHGSLPMTPTPTPLLRLALGCALLGPCIHAQDPPSPTSTDAIRWSGDAGDELGLDLLAFLELLESEGSLEFVASPEVREALDRSEIRLRADLRVPSQQLGGFLEDLVLPRGFQLEEIGDGALRIEALGTPAPSDFEVASLFVTRAALPMFSGLRPAAAVHTVTRAPGGHWVDLTRMQAALASHRSVAVAFHAPSGRLILSGEARRVFALTQSLERVSVSDSEGVWVTFPLEQLDVDQAAKALETRLRSDAAWRGRADRIRVLADAGSGSLRVMAPAEDLNRLSRLVEAIDSSGGSSVAGQELEIDQGTRDLGFACEAIALELADAVLVHDTVRSGPEELPEAVRAEGNARILLDAESNSLLVLGTVNQRAQLLDRIRELDVLGEDNIAHGIGRGPSFELVFLDHVGVSDALQVLDGIIVGLNGGEGGPVAELDRRSNAVLLVASPRQIESMRGMLQRLDKSIGDRIESDSTPDSDPDSTSGAGSGPEKDPGGEGSGRP